MIDLSDKNFVEKTRSGYWVVEFYSPYCFSCTVFEKVITSLDKPPLNEKLPFGKINVTDNDETSDRFKIENIPVLLFMEDGVEIDRIEGHHNVKDVLQFLKRCVQQTKM